MLPVEKVIWFGSLYVSGRVADTRFDVRTADATAAAGTEQFMYAIIG